MQSLTTLTAPTSDQGASLYIGRLMTPTQVAAAMKGRTDQQARSVAKTWTFCGDVSAATFAHLKAARQGDIRFRISAFKSPLGVYAVLTHEVARHQHRFVLPLYEPSVARGFAGIARQGFGFLFGNDTKGDGLVVPAIASAAGFRPLRAMCVDADVLSARDLVFELPLVLKTLCARDAIPSLMPTGRIADVSVTVVMPEEILARLDVVHGPLP